MVCLPVSSNSTAYGPYEKIPSTRTATTQLHTPKRNPSNLKISARKTITQNIKPQLKRYGQLSSLRFKHDRDVTNSRLLFCAIVFAMYALCAAAATAPAFHQAHPSWDLLQKEKKYQHLSDLVPEVIKANYILHPWEDGNLEKGGAQGHVFRVTKTGSQNPQDLVLKVSKTPAMFKRELTISEELYTKNISAQCVNIIQIFDVIKPKDGNPGAIVMERGVPVRREMKLVEFCKLILGICRGLAFLHANGIAHCDMDDKGDAFRNVVLHPELLFDRPMIIDFGLSKSDDYGRTDRHTRTDCHQLSDVIKAFASSWRDENLVYTLTDRNKYDLDAFTGLAEFLAMCGGEGTFAIAAEMLKDAPTFVKPKKSDADEIKIKIMMENLWTFLEVAVPADVEKALSPRVNSRRLTAVQNLEPMKASASNPWFVLSVLLEGCVLFLALTFLSKAALALVAIYLEKEDPYPFDRDLGYRPGLAGDIV